jgi:hypothetical protein
MSWHSWIPPGQAGVGLPPGVQPNPAARRGPWFPDPASTWLAGFRDLRLSGVVAMRRISTGDEVRGRSAHALPRCLRISAPLLSMRVRHGRQDGMSLNDRLTNASPAFRSQLPSVGAALTVVLAQLLQIGPTDLGAGH